MTLAQVLEDRFRGDIRFRGAAYLKAERVSITRVTADEIFAVVRDGIDYQTQLTRDDGQLRMQCTCAQPDKPFIPCKHLWATILAVDTGELIAGSIKPGHIPPFAVEPNLDLPTDDYWEADSKRDVYVPSSRARVARETLIAAPVLKPWETQLNSLSTALFEATTVPAAGTTAKERMFFYEIDAVQSRERRLLVLQTAQRQRRVNGQWGRRKPLKLRPSQLDDIDQDDDRRILAHLMGGVPERNTWYAQQSELQATAHRYQVPYSLAEIVLPLMCATGRTVFLGDDESARGEGRLERPARQFDRAGHPMESTAGSDGRLEWDDGPPWELCVDVVSNAGEEQWLLEGRLVRGSESLPLRESALLLPGGFVFVRNKVGRLQDFGAFDWVELLRSGAKVQVPREDGHELVDRLLDMPHLPRLELPPELRLEEVRCTPVPHLTLHTPRGVRWQHERLHGDVGFEYEGTRIRSTSPQGAIVQRELGRCIPRDREREEAGWSDLQQLGFRRLANVNRGRYDIEIPAKTLGPAVRGLIRLGWQIHADGKQVHQPGNLQFQIKSGIDWFELHAKVDFEGRSLPFPELLAALSRGDCTVRLDDGSLGILPEEWFKQFGLLSGLGISEEDHVRFSKTQVGLLDALLAAQDAVQYDAGFEELRERIRSFDGIQVTNEPAGFHGHLRKYQLDGFGWLKFLEDFRFGGCLADDMGLGKTIQLLALLQDRHEREQQAAGAGEPHRPSLVVVPKSLIFNWQQECKRFTPQLKILEYTGMHRTRVRKRFAKADVILTTYGTVRRDVLFLRDVAFEFVVLDEAQAIKNAGSQVAKAVRLLQAKHRLALSGTPIENHLSDLWSIFEFLNPGMLGRASIFKMQTADARDAESRRLLSQALRPFILRRTKKEVAAELPDKIEQTILCNMGKQQEALYSEMREHYRASLLGIIEKQGLARSKLHVLEALLRLRQAACHPALLDQSRLDESSAKLDALTLHLQDLLEEGHKALVFSQFTSFLAIVKRHLDQRKIVYEYLDGSTVDRKERIEHFQSDPDCGVFLISLKAGGLGLNLTAADYVFLLDPWWNPAVELQAIDRAHRIGQLRQVFAYRLICKGTVEEKIAELQNRKKELADAILQADNNLITDLSPDDLQLLLS